MRKKTRPPRWRASVAQLRNTDSLNAWRAAGLRRGSRLRMPADSTHPILEVIAGDTRLTLVEVREEQQARIAESTSRRPQTP